MSSSLLRVRLGPWLWNPRVDVAVFLGSAAVALALVVGRRVLGLGGDLPEWGWIAFVLGIDVAHVYATLFRTYLDGTELRRHSVRYVGIPLLVYTAGVALHTVDGVLFWRVLAYLAVFHFVRQQVGWAALYRARDPEREPVDALIDGAALYAATLYPLLVWHVSPGDQPFAWLVPGDFIALPALAAVEPFARTSWGMALAVFFGRQVHRGVTGRPVAAGRCMIVATTALLWYVGIVGGTDFDFTVTNVIAHGVPYVALLWGYTEARARLREPSVTTTFAAAGLGSFVAVLLALAFLEEMAWDRLVWGDRHWLFGGEGHALGAGLDLIVPLLALPQATHYLLDGLLWRRGDAARNEAQREMFAASALPS